MNARYHLYALSAHSFLTILAGLLPYPQHPSHRPHRCRTTGRSSVPSRRNSLLRHAQADRRQDDLPYSSPALSERDLAGAGTTFVKSQNRSTRGWQLAWRPPQSRYARRQERRGERVQGTLLRKQAIFLSGSRSAGSGMGEGALAPRREAVAQSSRFSSTAAGQLDPMEPRWQTTLTVRENPAAMLGLTEGWGLFVAAQWCSSTFAARMRAHSVPWKAIGGENVAQNVRTKASRGERALPPWARSVPGLYDFSCSYARDPAKLMKDFSVITGRGRAAAKWAVGLLHSPRTLETKAHARHHRHVSFEERSPRCVIYLAPGFARAAEHAGSRHSISPAVFHASQSRHARCTRKNVKLVRWTTWSTLGCAKSPTCLSIPRQPANPSTRCTPTTATARRPGHRRSRCVRPDEGDWVQLASNSSICITVFEGPLPANRTFAPDLASQPVILALHGAAGSWSGDTESSWKTLEGTNLRRHQSFLTFSPTVGSDIAASIRTRTDRRTYGPMVSFRSVHASFRSQGRTLQRASWAGIERHGAA